VRRAAERLLRARPSARSLDSFFAVDAHIHSLQPIREGVIGLHVGQVVIVALVATVVTGLLLGARRTAAGRERYYRVSAQELQARIDSLYGGARRLRRLGARPTPSGSPVAASIRQMLDSADERYDVPSLPLVSRYLSDAGERDSAALNVILLNAAIVAVVGFSLWVIWVWFGGRTKPGGSATRSEASG